MNQGRDRREGNGAEKATAETVRAATVESRGPRPTGRPRRGGGRERSADPARRAAFDVLRAVDERDAYANLACRHCWPSAASPAATPPSPPN